MGVELGDARKRVGKLTDGGKRYKPCLPDVRIPRGASAVKQHADALLVLSDENNTSL